MTSLPEEPFYSDLLRSPNFSEVNVSAGILIFFGRFPETGFGHNLESEMEIFVSYGKVLLYLAGDELILKRGDIMFIPPRVNYFLCSEEGVEILVHASPRWTAEQCLYIPPKDEKQKPA